MISQCRCVEAFTGDAFGVGEFLKFEEGGAYALPSAFIEANKDKFEDINKIETKPLRQALEIKGNKRTRKRTNKPK